jgi:hypothetical protein
MEEMIGNTVVDGRRRPPVDEKHGGGQGLNPIGRRHGGMNQERANNIVECAKHPLSFAVLGGCVGARSTKKDATASQEGGGGSVDELGAIICLKTAQRITELCVSVSNKLNNMLMNFRFMAQRKRPTVMGKIIN